MGDREVYRKALKEDIRMHVSKEGRGGEDVCSLRPYITTPITPLSSCCLRSVTYG